MSIHLLHDSPPDYHSNVSDSPVTPWKDGDPEADSAAAAAAAGDTGDQAALYPDSTAQEPTEAERRRMGIRQFPGGVYPVLGMEFCERFSFYGMRAVLYIFLLNYFDLDEPEATLFYHLFVVAAYLMPIFGGILSDNFIGKFRTILSLSIVYAIGSYVLAVTAIPGTTGVPPSPWGAIVGLLLIAVGTGGIKPCVSSYGGDQVVKASKGLSEVALALQVQLYFSLFYFSINTGSVLSTVITPILRGVACFGREDCFSLAFGVPAILMSVAVVVFVSGHRFYVNVPPEKNILLRVVITIFGGFRGARDKYGPAFVEDVRAFLHILLVLTPAPFFWALFDQTASKWVQQATEMERQVGALYIPPDLMQVANSLFILLLIPVFEKGVYPLFRRWWPLLPLRRMGVGLVLTVISFVMAGFLQLWINTGTFGPDPSDSDCESCCLSGCVNIMFQIPQYLVLTAGEVMFSITGLEFAYSQAPESMRSVTSAFWLLTVAVGNIVVMIISGSQAFPNRAYEFLFYAALLLLVTFIFVFLARRYKYKN